MGLSEQLSAVIIGGFLTLIPLCISGVVRFIKWQFVSAKSRRAAARALRDDFYGMQEELVRVCRNGHWLEQQQHEWHYVGSNDHLLIIANAMDGQNGWSVIATARRRLIAAAQLRQSGIYPGPDWAVRTFDELESGRQATIRVDPNWIPNPHPDSRAIRDASVSGLVKRRHRFVRQLFGH